MKPKTKLKNGGYVAELVASGEAEIALHQISEIAPVKGAKLVGPLPAEIQNYTTYAVGVAADAKQPDAAKAMIKLLSGSEAADVLKRRGMEKPPA
jgi:molybdate transport system substrate-binding protein